jgi:cyclopropane-fatty-acyl-phospholipid synthase
MTNADIATGSRRQVVSAASTPARFLAAVAEGLTHGVAYAAQNYFARAASPIDPEQVWHFFTRRQNFVVQALVDHHPPHAQRQRVLARFLDRSHADGIAYHYDVSNDFYALFLDRDFMFYSCADFHSPHETLEQAQRHKADHILVLLDPKPGEKIVELGCGWGSMLRHVHAATQDGHNLVGLTLSQDQAAYIRENFSFKVMLDDFVRADLGVESYDKIYSIGAFEHIRPDDLLPLYRKMHAALKPGGRAVLHFFSLNGTDRLPTSMVGAQMFFPGSVLSLHADHLRHADAAGFTLTHDSEHDYRPTLRAWFERLVANRARAEALVGIPLVNKYLVFFASSWAFFNLRKATLHRLVLQKNSLGSPLSAVLKI